MKIGILQTGHVPDELVAEFGEYPAMFERLLAGHGFSFRTWAVVDMEFPADVHEADGWLLTGSRHGAYEDLPFIAPLEAFIRDAYSAHVPMVGVCFGHQIIAKALGGRVEKFPQGWSIGPETYDFGGDPVTINAWHQDQVIERPADAKVAAASAFCANAALIYDDRAFTVQAHPEFSTAFIEGLMRTRGKALPPAVLESAAGRLALPIESWRVADRMAAFFKQSRR